MPTPHIEAKPGDFADTVLLPGDPLRARWIASEFLDAPRQVTGVRNMLGYTGFYQERRVSVMGSGMGIPSIAIYAQELIECYGVEQLIRVGTCGAVLDEMNLGDLVLAMGASTDSQINRLRFGGYDLAALADFQLLKQVWYQAQRQNLPLHVGNIFSSDRFYTEDPGFWPLMARFRILGVEMEAAGLYGVASACGARALTVCTVSDHIPRQEHLSAQSRERGVRQMVDLVLQSLVDRGAAPSN